MNCLAALAVFLPLVRSQIFFPGEVVTSISSISSPTSAIPGLQEFSTSLSAPSAVSVDLTEVRQQSHESALLASFFETPFPEMELTVISSLRIIPSGIPGSFSATTTSVTPVLKPLPVDINTIAGTFTEIPDLRDEESLISSVTSTTAETSVTRITPRPTFVSRTTLPDIASDISQSSINTKAPLETFIKPNPVDLEPNHQPSPTAIDPSTSIDLFGTSTMATSPLSVLEDSETTGTFPNTEASPAQEVDSQLVINEMENESHRSDDEESNDIEPCLTPRGEKGRCTHLNSCSGFNPIKSRTDSNIAVNFLRERVCRIRPRSLLFCCPDGPPLLPTII